MQTAQDPKPGRNGNHPPKQHQFKPGQSGNPGGRPKRVFTDLLHAYMIRNDQELAREFVRDLVKSARAGNRTAISFIVNRLDNLHLALAPELYEPSNFDDNAEAFEKDRIEKEKREAEQREARERKEAARRLIWDSVRGQLVRADSVAATPPAPSSPADEEDDYEDDEEYEDGEGYEDEEEGEHEDDAPGRTLRVPRGSNPTDDSEAEEQAEDEEDGYEEEDPEDPAQTPKDQGPRTEDPNNLPPPTKPATESPAILAGNPEQYCRPTGRPGGRRGPTHSVPNDFAQYANGPWIDI